MRELQAWVQGNDLQIWSFYHLLNEGRRLQTYKLNGQEPDQRLERAGFFRISDWQEDDWKNGLPPRKYCVVDFVGPLRTEE